ncbi:hypothetical protein CJ195_13125 [Bacillus sp. UMB0899]|nr:hypothetical protein CJ195_13125 [Bacillus sp. UMB0899]
MEWSGRHSTPAGSRGKAETPQAKPRRLSFLPAESECLQRNETNYFLSYNCILNNKVYEYILHSIGSERCGSQFAK